MRSYFCAVLILFVAASLSAQSEPRHPVVYVMPGPLAGPGASANSTVLVDSGQKAKEPQVAKTYQELQHNKECQGISPNLIRDKADYFLLVEHGGGKGNRWAVSDNGGNVVGSGDAFKIGTAVKDACVAMRKNWQPKTSPATK